MAEVLQREIVFNFYKFLRFHHYSLYCCSYEKCGCVSPYLWNTRSIVIPGTERIILALLCNESNACYKDVIIEFIASAELLSEYCFYCDEQCSTTEFIVQASFLTAALQWQIDGIRQFVEQSNISLPTNWSTMWRKHIEQNYVGVMVMSETDIVESNIQRAKYSVVSILSNIGGQTGLWIGISFLSMMEVIEMIYRLFRHECRRVRNKMSFLIPVSA